MIRNRTWRWWLITVLKFTVVIGAFLYLTLSGKLQLGNLLPSRHNIYYIIFGFVMILCALSATFIRFWLLLRAVCIPIGIGEAFRIGFISSFCNLFLLGTTSGDMARLIYITRITPRRAEVISSIILDRSIALIGLLSIGGATLLINPQQVASAPALYELATILIALVAGFVFVLLTGIVSLAKGRFVGMVVWLFILLGSGFVSSEMQPIIPFAAALTFNTATPQASAVLILIGASIVALMGILCAPSFHHESSLEKFIKSRVPLGEKFISLTSAVWVYRNHFKTLIACFVLSILMYSISMSAIYMMAQSTLQDQTVRISQVFFAGPLAFLANTLPLPGGGLGVGETTFDGLLALCRDEYGNPVRGGAAIFLMWRCWTFIIVLLGMAFCVKRKAL